MANPRRRTIILHLRDAQRQPGLTIRPRVCAMRQKGTIPTRISTFDKLCGVFMEHSSIYAGTTLFWASDSSEVILCRSWQSLASDESAEIQQSKVDIILWPRWHQQARPLPQHYPRWRRFQLLPLPPLPFRLACYPEQQHLLCLQSHRCRGKLI